MRLKYTHIILSFCAVIIGFVITQYGRSNVSDVPARMQIAHIMDDFLHSHANDVPLYKPQIYDFTPAKIDNAPSTDESLVKAKVSECESHWPALPFAYSKKMQPMVIRNARHSAVTMQMEPVDPKPRRWSIAPGATWKTFTHVGQRWLASDHKRCLFYVTAGDEPLKMVVNSAM